MEKANADNALAALRVPAQHRTTEQIAVLVAWCESKGVAPGGAKVNLDLLSRAMKLEEYPDATVLFRQGDSGSTYYIVFSGEVAIFVNSAMSALSLMQVCAGARSHTRPKLGVTASAHLDRSIFVSRARQGSTSSRLVSRASSTITSKDASKDASVRQTPAPGSGSSSVKQTPGSGSGSFKQTPRRARLGSLLGGASMKEAMAKALAESEPAQAEGGGAPGAAPAIPEAAAAAIPEAVAAPSRLRSRRSSKSINCDRFAGPIGSSDGAVAEPPDLGKCVLAVAAGHGFGDLALISSQPRAASAVVRGGPAQVIIPPFHNAHPSPTPSGWCDPASQWCVPSPGAARRHPTRGVR